MPYRIKGDNKELPMVHEKIARIKSKITKIIDDENLCSSAIYIRKLQKLEIIFLRKRSDLLKCSMKWIDHKKSAKLLELMKSIINATNQKT